MSAQGQRYLKHTCCYPAPETPYGTSQRCYRALLHIQLLQAEQNRNMLDFALVLNTMFGSAEQHTYVAYCKAEVPCRQHSKMPNQSIPQWRAKMP